MKNGTTVLLQKKIVEEIDRIIDDHPELFYRTRTDFICDAIRRHVRHIQGGN